MLRRESAGLLQRCAKTIINYSCPCCFNVNAYYLPLRGHFNDHGPGSVRQSERQMALRGEAADFWDVSSSWYPSDDIPPRKPLELQLQAAAQKRCKSVFPPANHSGNSAHVTQSESAPSRKSAAAPCRCAT
ncbi:hypothetical protein CRENBAI_002909 [Crenichthys baileyi]|uniref:Uncharacterized protein n=1 Tax=Crenichthys baileyi TaxID=28760 RepID=A0AAV9S8V2_9TELE